MQTAWVIILKCETKKPDRFERSGLGLYQLMLIRTTFPVAFVFDHSPIPRAHNLFSQAYTTGYSIMKSKSVDW